MERGIVIIKVNHTNDIHSHFENLGARKENFL